MPNFCHKCGAKFAEKRTQCPRCLEPHVQAASVQAPAPSADKNTRWLIGAGLALLVLVAGAVSMRSGGDPAAAVAETTPAQKVAPARARVQQSSPTSNSGLDRSFMDSDRAGNAAYLAGDHNRALVEYQKAIEKNPDDVMSLNNLGQVLVRTGRPAEAIAYFNRAIELNASVWAPHFNLARAYSTLGDGARAIAEYKVAASLLPDDYVTVYNLGLALHKSGNEEAAITEFRRAAELAPSEPSFHLSMGISYERLKKPVDAVQAYEDYLSLAPEAADAAQVRSRIQTLKNPS